mmetsp:Transcript_121230/g.339490  ORF Transcript_121230/g.339490 Transcript_121230/m.339490 type:complete len:201 (-) Transcript_121230:2-604(-)
MSAFSAYLRLSLWRLLFDMRLPFCMGCVKWQNRQAAPWAHPSQETDKTQGLQCPFSCPALPADGNWPASAVAALPSAAATITPSATGDASDAAFQASPHPSANAAPRSLQSWPPSDTAQSLAEVRSLGVSAVLASSLPRLLHQLAHGEASSSVSESTMSAQRGRWGTRAAVHCAMAGAFQLKARRDDTPPPHCDLEQKMP